MHEHPATFIVISSNLPLSAGQPGATLGGSASRQEKDYSAELPRIHPKDWPSAE